MIEFLMHRVELKEFFEYILRNILIKVPNAPCGVESSFACSIIGTKLRFLMHRVELKDRINLNRPQNSQNSS